jgi:GDP-fucose transporter C1
MDKKQTPDVIIDIGSSTKEVRSEIPVETKIDLCPGWIQPIRPDVFREVVRIALVVTFYFIVSLSMVVLNKLVLDQLEFPYALFMTWIQLLVALCCIYVFGLLAQRVEALSFLPPFEFDWNIAKKVMPLTIVYISMIGFNNLCLQFVQVSFYQVARGLTVLWTCVFSYVILRKSITLRTFIAVVVVFVGFVTASVGEIHFDWKGLIFGVISSAFVALYGIYVKKVLPHLNENQWRLLIYNTVLAIFLLFPFTVITGEVFHREMWTAFFSASVFSMLLLSGLMGYLINIAIFMQIRYTSALTNAVSGTAKGCLQTAVGWLLFGNEISLTNLIGILTVIFGSFWYSQIQFQEMKKKSDVEKQKSEQNPSNEERSERK